MKENIDIEKLFKDKFENFEGSIDPQVWSNISQGIGTNVTAAAVQTGLSLTSKIITIASVAVLTSAIIYGVYGLNAQADIKDNIVKTDTLTEETKGLESETPAELKSNIIMVHDQNDPVIKLHKADIEETLQVNTVNNFIHDQDAISTIESNIDIDISELNDILVFKESFESKSSDLNNLLTDENLADNTVKHNDGEKIDDAIKNPSPEFKINYSQDIKEELLVSFKSEAVNFESLVWQFGDGTTSTELNPKHYYREFGIYTANLIVIGKDKQEYSKTVSVNVNPISSISEIPNVFTPNGDGLNDELFIKSKNIESFYIVIYSRDSDKVFESSNVDFRWSGEDLKGNMIKKDLYLYALKAVGTDGKGYKKTGNLSLN